MAETKKVSLSSLSKGSYIVLDGVACRVTDTAKSKPGKHGSAKINLTASGIFDGKRRNIVGPADEQVDAPLIDKRQANVLSIAGTTASVMDTESFETFDLPIPDELKDSVVEGCTILYWEVLSDRVMQQVVKTE